MQKSALEKSPLFPYVAWTLVICFSVFVGSLTLELRQTVNELEKITQSTSASLAPVPQSGDTLEE